jgi:phosphatidylglycerophosphatase A
MAGFLVTLFLIPWGVKSLLTGFVLFRLMDIVKPFPAKWLELNLKGGWGVVADDLMAGVYANILLRLVMGVF